MMYIHTAVQSYPPAPTSTTFSSCKTVAVTPHPASSHPLAVALPLPLSVNMRKQKCHERGIVHICPPGMGSFPKHPALKMHVLGPNRCQNAPGSEANTVGAGGVIGNGGRWGEGGELAAPCPLPLWAPSLEAEVAPAGLQVPSTIDSSRFGARNTPPAAPGCGVLILVPQTALQLSVSCFEYWAHV